MLFERRRFQRVGVEAAAEVVRDLRAALGACGAGFLLGGAALRVELLQLGSFTSQFDRLMAELRIIAPAIGRSICLEPVRRGGWGS